MRLTGRPPGLSVAIVPGGVSAHLPAGAPAPCRPWFPLIGWRPEARTPPGPGPDRAMTRIRGQFARGLRRPPSGLESFAQPVAAPTLRGNAGLAPWSRPSGRDVEPPGVPALRAVRGRIGRLL